MKELLFDGDHFVIVQQREFLDKHVIQLRNKKKSFLRNVDVDVEETLAFIELETIANNGTLKRGWT